MRNPADPLPELDAELRWSKAKKRMELAAYYQQLLAALDIKAATAAAAWMSGLAVCVTVCIGFMPPRTASGIALPTTAVFILLLIQSVQSSRRQALQVQGDYERDHQDLLGEPSSRPLVSFLLVAPSKDGRVKRSLGW